MNYLLIYFIVTGIGICIDITRLVFAKILKLEIEEFSIFIGPKLMSTTLYNTKFTIRAVPFGSSMTFNNSFLERDRFSKMVLIYLPVIIFFIVALIVINNATSYVLVISSIILLLLNGFQQVKSIIFDDYHVFYRYKKRKQK